MSWFTSWLHPERGYEKGQDELDKYYNQGQGYVAPYNQFGQNAYNDYSGVMKQLLNPQGLQDEWSKGYKESDAAKFSEGLANDEGLDAASSMGMLGSTPGLQALQAGKAGIVANDKQNYMDNLMQKLLAGAGIAGNIFGTGANAAGTMSNNANNMGSNSAQMQYNKTNAPGGQFSSLLGMGAGVLGSALGGPLGGAIGSKLGWSTTGGK